MEKKKTIAAAATQRFRESVGTDMKEPSTAVMSSMRWFGDFFRARLKGNGKALPRDGVSSVQPKRRRAIAALAAHQAKQPSERRKLQSFPEPLPVPTAYPRGFRCDDRGCRPCWSRGERQCWKAIKEEMEEVALHVMSNDEFLCKRCVCC